MRYFAYGMNLDHGTMEYLEVVPLSRAVLPDYELVFRRFADVEPRLGFEVLGGLWEIDDVSLRSLDAREGYPRHYDRTEAEVWLPDGSRERAIVYFMTEDVVQWYRRTVHSHMPSRSYMNMIRRGRIMFGYGERYNEGLPELTEWDFHELRDVLELLKEEAV